MVLLSNRSIPTRGRAQQPISCKDSGFLWIMDALYALSDTYLHFPRDYMDKRGRDLSYRKKEGNEMNVFKAAGCRKKGELLRLKMKRLYKEEHGIH